MHRRNTILGGVIRAGNGLLDLTATVMMLVLLLYSAYCLWDNYNIDRAAFAADGLMSYKPVAQDGQSAPTMEELQALNPDVRGWITVDGTHIDYPVVQGADNMQYVNTSVLGEFSLSGAIFLDSRCAADLSDPYLLLYGHHMDSGAMFGDVTNFLEQAYFDSHPTGTLTLADGTVFQMTFFACVAVDASDPVIYTPDSGNGLEALLTRIQQTAVQSRELADAPDRVIGLSTCLEAETNGRAVLFGSLEPANSRAA